MALSRLTLSLAAAAILAAPAYAKDVKNVGISVGLRNGDEKAPHRHWSRITDRQREVMRWLAIGLDNAAIGQKLRIGERAVKAHVSSLLGLFGLANRTQLALMADRAGLRPPNRR